MSSYRAVGIAAVAALAAAAVSAGSAALANGAGAEIYRDSVGPYELIVRVQPEAPKVGAVHVTFEPTAAGTSEPLQDATISVLARDENGVDQYIVRAVNTPQERRYYDANLTFQAAGEWMLVVDIESTGASTVTFEVPMTVEPQLIPPRSVGGTVAWLLVSGILVGGAAFVWYRSRQALRARRSAGQG